MSFKSNVFTLDYPKGANRVDLYDFMRGIAMIIVMIQHSGFPGGPYLVAFHMPLFFFLSGMVASRRTLPSFGVYIYGKFKRLMIPYFSFGLLALTINYIKLSSQGIPYDITKAALGVLTGQYGFVPPAQSGLYWFLFVMFMADLMVYPINKYLRNSMAAKVGEAVREPNAM